MKQDERKRNKLSPHCSRKWLLDIQQACILQILSALVQAQQFFPCQFNLHSNASMVSTPLVFSLKTKSSALKRGCPQRGQGEPWHSGLPNPCSGLSPARGGGLSEAGGLSWAALHVTPRGSHGDTALSQLSSRARGEGCGHSPALAAVHPLCTS